MGRRLAWTTGLVLGLLALAWPRRERSEGPLELDATFYATKVRVGTCLRPTFHLRNVSGRPIEAQTGQGWGYGLRVELRGPSGVLIPFGCQGPLGETPPPGPGDFETLPPGGWSRSLHRAPRLPPIRVPGRHVLRYAYVRPPPENPSWWERMTGRAELSLSTAERMERAWQGLVQGEIVFDAY